MIHRISAKLGNMRKEQEFLPQKTDKGNYVVQSDKSIGIFDDTGKGVLNTRGCYFPHLNPALGAKPYQFPAWFVAQVKELYPNEGDLIGASPETGPVYYGGIREI